MNRSRTIRSRMGFTLIEMLVSVTLVLMMMVMFGEIFQLATNSVSKQRVMADNDQNTRTFVTVIRGDLDKRSFRTLVPFYANEPVDKGTPFDPRRGYFSISNNNTDDGTDDVLSFTTDVSINVQNEDASQFFGKALLLPQALRNPSISDTVRRTQFLRDTNQPERDDGQITPNEAGASSAAEISYWMRGGKLYRRVMLLREPVIADDDAQPQDANNNPYFLPANYPNEDTNGNGILDSGEDANGNGVLDGNFWGEFDYSARFPMPPLIAYMQLNGIDSLRNNQTNLPFPPPPPGYSPWMDSLGQTWNRFGHNQEILANSLLNGLPREFTSTAGSPRFIGRFTQQETSDARFQFPQRPSNPGGVNPMDASNAVTLNSDGLITQFDRGNRVGVDLLLSHVHEFRVEAWDERLQDFAPIGHSRTNAGGIEGDYHINRRLNSTYGPLGGVFNVFDTWHPQFNRNRNVDGAGNPILGDEPDRPLYRPLNYDPTSGLTGAYPATGAGPLPPGPTRYWTPGQNYSLNNVVFPAVEDINGNGVLDGGEDGLFGFPADGALSTQRDEDAPPLGNGDNMLQPAEDTNGNGTRDRTLLPFEPFGNTFSYRCIKAGQASNDPYAEPRWSTTPGFIMRGNPADIDLNGNGVVDLGDTDYNGNGVVDPTEPDWLVEYNARPLKAIRITVRFEHPTSKQMKQVTIVHSLRDTTAVP